MHGCEMLADGVREVVVEVKGKVVHEMVEVTEGKPALTVRPGRWVRCKHEK